MGEFVDFVARSVGVIIDADTLIGDYTPSVTGRLKGVIVIPGGIAATTAIENGHVKLACKTFGGVDMFSPFTHGGAQTAPWPPGVMTQETKCDLQITAGVPIHVSYYYNVLPTTPELVIFARIEA